MSVTGTEPRVLVETIRIAWVRDIALVIAAVGIIGLSAQISVPLPFTPVPLTFQTLGVLYVVSALGAWRGLITTGLYLVAAIAGLPVLAPTADGEHLTGFDVLTMPTLGYVLGFILAGFVVGRLAEAGYSRTPVRTAIAMMIGNVVIYAIGLLVLKASTGADLLTSLQWGLFPFLIGDAFKIVLAAGLLPATWHALNKLGHKI